MDGFADDFLFGCATSAYQIEGGIENDWSAWERAGRLKDPAARAGEAVGHWSRWREDFDRLGELGVKGYRFSIEWARVEPTEGQFDEAAVAQYVEMVDDLLRRGITPFVTFLHFTHPPWFHATCPWHDLKSQPWLRFARFVDHVVQAFGERVLHFTILNEPNVWLSGAYVSGKIPPGIKSLRRTCQAAESLIRAHVAASEKIRARLAEKAQIGVAHNQVVFEASRPNHPVDRLAQGYMHTQFNHAFLRAMTTGVLQLGKLPGIRYRVEIPGAKDSLDFIGVNYYFRAFVQVGFTGPDLFVEDRSQRGTSDLGWEIHPEGLGRFLREIGDYGLPLYITENGMDDRDDTRRSAFIHDHLQEVLQAKEAGVDIRGYFHWSLLDNFEWLEGMLPSFGLYGVNRQTLERHLTKSGRYYQDVVKNRRLGERPKSPPPKPPKRTPLGYFV